MERTSKTKKNNCSIFVFFFCGGGSCWPCRRFNGRIKEQLSQSREEREREREKKRRICHCGQRNCILNRKNLKHKFPRKFACTGRFISLAIPQRWQHRRGWPPPAPAEAAPTAETVVPVPERVISPAGNEQLPADGSWGRDVVEPGGCWEGDRGHPAVDSVIEVTRAPLLRLFTAARETHILIYNQSVPPWNHTGFITIAVTITTDSMNQSNPTASI